MLIIRTPPFPGKSWINVFHRIRMPEMTLFNFAWISRLITVNVRRSCLGSKLDGVDTQYKYCTSSIRRHGYYFFHCTCWCGYYSRAAFISLKRPQTSTTAGRAIQWQLLDAVSSKHSLSVLLSAMKRSCTTRTANISHAYVYATCDTSRGYYLRAVFILLRASDSKAESVQRNAYMNYMNQFMYMPHTYFSH